MTDEPTLALGPWTRRGLALALVVLAIVHIAFPGLGIDGVFLGLLALAVVVLKFDIRSIDVLGVKATARELAAEAQQVREAQIPPSEPKPLPPPGPDAPPTTQHRPLVDLMPPTDPAVRVLWSVEQIRIELIVLAGNRGILTDARPWDSYRQAELAELLSRNNVVPSQMIGAIRSVVEQRNLLAHGRLASLDLLTPLDDLAVTLVARLREIPREYVRIRDTDIALYKDRSMTAHHPLSPGVAVEQRGMDGNLLVVQVFPAGRHYSRGRFVTWEWDSSRGSREEAWFADVADHGPQLAFSESATFAGREYPDQWGLQYRGGPLLDDSR